MTANTPTETKTWTSNYTTQVPTEVPILAGVKLTHVVDYFVITMVPVLFFMLIGNVTVLCAILRTKTLRTKGHAFVISLSASSLLLLLFNIPSTVYTYLCKCGLPPIWCTVVGHSNSIAIILTMSNMANIAMYRFFKVVFSTKIWMSGNTAVAVIQGLTVTVAVGVPSMLLGLEATHIGFSPIYHKCKIDWRTSTYWYGIFVLCMFSSCLIIAIACYVSIYVVLVKSSSKVGTIKVKPKEETQPGTSREGNPQGKEEYNKTQSCKCKADASIPHQLHCKTQRQNRKREMKLFKICCILFGVYTVAYLPYTLLAFSGSVSPDLHKAFTMMTWVGVCASPLVYGLLYGAVRAEICSMLCCKPVVALLGRCHHSEDTTRSTNTHHSN